MLPLWPPLGDGEPDDGVRQGEVGEHENQNPAVHQRSHRLRAYQAHTGRVSETRAASAVLG